MLLLITIDSTEEAPVQGVEAFANADELKQAYGYGDDDDQAFTDAELDELIATGVFYGDKRMILQVQEIEIQADQCDVG
jgi:hypothetical protein